MTEYMSHPREVKWSPYANNGGTVIGIAGPDWVVMASDTRLSQGYSIATRDSPKWLQLTDKTALVSAGFSGDRVTLHKNIQARLAWYEHQNFKKMSTEAAAQMLSTMLYYKRFFPYYTFNILGGLDENGVGAVFGYDAVGSFERGKMFATGSGQTLIQPLLDSQIGKKNQGNFQTPDMNCEETIDFIKDAFTSAGERDIYTGDAVDIIIIRTTGVTTEKFALKKD
eukprot:TRINITY_DN1327_c0_g1_i1.p1 TRINITY_DN1327_c0_g1~~TRINITY_DN1327_c0_g1_i1.p1  ORF type:complete len:225 (-),score=62.57 TRINITY_DN1327_c0_g1_i1:76-750(-)